MKINNKSLSQSCAEHKVRVLLVGSRTPVYVHRLFFKKLYIFLPAPSPNLPC